jgi:Sec-independent protein secretion pathway component TatC
MGDEWRWRSLYLVGAWGLTLGVALQQWTPCLYLLTGPLGPQVGPLLSFRVTEGVTLWLGVSGVVATVCTLPLVAYQGVCFVRPGLYGSSGRWWSRRVCLVLVGQGCLLAVSLGWVAPTWCGVFLQQQASQGLQYLPHLGTYLHTLGGVVGLCQLLGLLWWCPGLDWGLHSRRRGWLGALLLSALLSPPEPLVQGLGTLLLGCGVEWRCVWTLRRELGG